MTKQYILTAGEVAALVLREETETLQGSLQRLLDRLNGHPQGISA